MNDSDHAPSISFNEAIAGLTNAGWKIVTDGPTGVTMESPKKFDVKDKVIAVLGVILLFVSPYLGLVLISVALLDFAFFQKSERKFFPRK